VSSGSVVVFVNISAELNRRRQLHQRAAFRSVTYSCEASARSATTDHICSVDS
jgi:hypothetical protein